MTAPIPTARDAAPTATVRECFHDILGEQLTTSLIDDMGIEWATVTAIAMMETKGGPQNAKQRAFVRWVREQNREVA